MTNQYAFDNAFKVTYPDFPGFEEIPSTIRLIQKASHQDIVEIQYFNVSSFYQNALKPGSLIKLNWMSSSVRGQFFGQVVSVLPTKTFGQNNPTTIKAIGTGLSLKENTPKIWLNKTASEIVQEIAKKFKLKPIVSPTKVRLTQESMVGQTYWQKLRELANKSGYVFHVFETELYFVPFDTMINTFMGSIPFLSLETNYGDGYDNIYQSNLLEFKTESSAIPSESRYSNRTKNIMGIDPFTGKVFTHKTSPSEVGKALRKNTTTQVFSEQMFGITVGSKALAESRAKSEAIVSSFSEHAKGIAQGDPRISPFKTIHVDGTGNSTDGFWMIKDAEHFMTHDGRYTVDFSCMTDGTGNNKTSSFRQTPSKGVSVRNVAYELASGLQAKPSVTKLNSNRLLIKQSDNGIQLKQRKWVGK